MEHTIMWRVLNNSSAFRVVVAAGHFHKPLSSERMILEANHVPLKRLNGLFLTLSGPDTYTHRTVRFIPRGLQRSL